MALSFQESLALARMISSDVPTDSLATAGYGSPSREEVATYDDKTSQGITYNKNYPIYDVFEDAGISVVDLNKKVTVNSSQFNLTQERNSQFIPFSIARYCDGYDLSNGVIWIVTDAGEDGKTWPVRPVNVYVNEEEQKIYFGWLVDEYITRKPGTVNFEIHIHGQVYGVDQEEQIVAGYVWKSKPGSLNVAASKFDLDGALTDAYNELLETNKDWLRDMVIEVSGAVVEQQLQVYTDKAEAAQKGAEDAKDEVVKAVEYVDGRIASVEEAIQDFTDKMYVADPDSDEPSGDFMEALKKESRQAANDALDTRIGIIKDTMEQEWEKLVTEYEHDQILGYEDAYPPVNPEDPEEEPVLLTVKDYVEKEISETAGSLTLNETSYKDVTSFVEAAMNAVNVSEQLLDYETIKNSDAKIDALAKDIETNYVKNEVLNDYYTSQTINDTLAGYATNVKLNEYYTKTETTSQINAAIENADIEGKLTEYPKTIDMNARIEERLGLGTDAMSMKDYVDEAVMSIDVTDELAAYTPLTRLGNLGTVGEGEEQRERTVEEAIAAIDVSSQLADYANKEYVENAIGTLQESVSKNASNLAATNTQLSNAQTDIANLKQSASNIYTYNVKYDATDGKFSLYQYTDEETQGEDETYEPKQTLIIQGGGGGGSSAMKEFKIEYITPSPLVITTNDKAELKYRLIGIDSSGDDIGDAVATWKVGNKVVKTETITTGENTFDITEYLSIGQQKVTLSVVEDSGNKISKPWTVNLVNVYLESDFRDTSVYTDEVEFTFTPYGALDKTVYFILDGEEIAKQTTSASGLSISQMIPRQSHGSHLLEVYMKAEISGKTIESNHIYKDIMWYDAEVGTPIISCVQQEFTARQYETTNITYTVYDPATETPSVILTSSRVDENGEIVIESSSAQTLGAGAQTWSYKTNVLGEHILTIQCKDTIKTLKATVVELGINVQPVTAGLAFDFDPVGYSNSDVNRLWSDGEVKMTVSENFDWINGGYQLDENGDQYFSIKAGTSAEINYELFGSDAKVNGKEFKLVFMTENVANGDAVFLECVSDTVGTDKIGLEMRVHEATIYGMVNSLPLPYSEEDIIEFEFNISNQESAIPAVEGYEDGVMTRPMVYDSTYEFQQREGYRKTITLGSDDCDLRVYRFKVYNKGLSDSEILNNFIADARNAEEMIARYDRNQIYENGAFTPKMAAKMCPDTRIIMVSCPYFTNDKSDYIGDTTIECVYTNGDPILDNWVATDAVHSGQGTSSNSYGPAGRNMDLILKKFSKKGVDYNTNPVIKLGDGTEVSKLTLTRESIPVNYFNVKVNIASSENANNALLARRYNEFNPYKRPFVREDESIIPYIKDTMEFQNCIIFVQERNPDIATHREFEDTDWHFYGIGNIGDSKKTDDTRLTDPEDPYECIIEVMDNTMPLSTMPTGKVDEKGAPVYPISVEEWETLENPAYSALYYETFDEKSGVKDDGSLNKPNGLDDTYGMRYRWEEGSDEENDAAWDYVKEKWREFYKFVVTSSDEEFKAHLGDYVVLNSILYYYIFTLRYTMTDNHAKNSFWHYGKCGEKDAEGNEIRKWDLSFDYDNDTSFGIDNYGRMSYRYGYEEIDFVDGTTQWVWNAPQHVFFLRIRELFSAELEDLYKTLESKGAWSSATLIPLFDNSQAQWPEEVWRLDIQRKYKRTYTTSGPFFEKKAYPEFYVERANGRKKYHRRQYERNQERYISSKFTGNLTTGDEIYMRSQSDSAPASSLAAVPPKFDLTITPYSYMYLNVKYNTAPPIKVRAVPNQEYTIQYEADSADIMYIYGASGLRSLGDLSPLYLTNGRFSRASKIRELVLGNHNENYDNPNTMTLELGENSLLNKIDVTNMSGLVQTLNLAQLKNLKELYAAGTSSAGVIFADGGLIETVDIPDVTSLIMKNLNYLDEDGFHTPGFTNLTSIVAENSTLDLLEIINAAPNLYRIRLTGINWRWEEDESAGINMLERLYKMAGTTSSGTNTDKSILAGVVYVPVIKEYEYYKYKEAWPDLDIQYGSMKTQHPVYFVNDDGTVLETQYVVMGERAEDPLEREENPLAIPTKESTISTYYTFAGWDTDFSELPILEPLTVKATYTSDLREYTIKYVSRGVVLDTKKGKYGDNILYDGPIPTYTGQESAYNFQLFNRWDKSGFLTEGPDGTDFVDGVKTVNAVYDEFQFTTSAFRGKELKDLSPVEIYALTRMGLDNIDIGQQIENEKGELVYEGLQKGDPFSFEMGYDVDYDDIESEVLIAEPYVFGGTNSKSDRLDTGIQLLQDRDFILAIDFKMDTDASAASVLAQCYNSYNSVGFQLGAGSSAAVSMKWGTSSLTKNVAKPGQREMIVLRHLKGENKLHVYSSNLNTADFSHQEISDKQGIFDSTLVFGCKRNDDGSYSNPGKGTIYWSKIWYSDLGEGVCEKLVGWTHEEIKLAIDGMKRYYITGTSKKTTFSLMGTQLLDRARIANSKSTNKGGYPAFDFFEILNTRFYNAMPIQIQALTKQVNAGYTVGENTATVEKGDFYVLIPTAYDVNAWTSSVPDSAKHHIVESGGDEGNRTDLINNETRKRMSADGTITDYWLRSTLYYPGSSGPYYNSLIYSVLPSGEVDNYTQPSSTRGILIEISF